jgi:mannose-6-phosphate isomerase-like protein (cupin superfamily)
MQARRNFIKTVSALSCLSALPAHLIARSSDQDQTLLKPVLIRRGEGEQVFDGSATFTRKLSASQTGGRFSCIETVIENGFMIGPPHLHHQLDEVMYVIEGTITMMVGEEVVEVHEGDWHLRPKKIVHTFWNTCGKRARTIDLFVPGGFEDYLFRLSAVYKKNGKIETSEVQKFIGKYDIEPRFDLLQPLLEKYHLKM